jgi:guanyl-specific ribonuclease Sa
VRSNAASSASASKTASTASSNRPLARADAARRDRHPALGGTILGTTNRGNPFAYPVDTSKAP